MIWSACVVLISINIIGLLNGVVLWKFPMKVGSGVVCTKCVISVSDPILDYSKSGWKCVAYGYFGHTPSLKWKVLCVQYSNKKIYMHRNRRLPISFKHRIQIFLVTAYQNVSSFLESPLHVQRPYFIYNLTILRHFQYTFLSYRRHSCRSMVQMLQMLKNTIC